MAQERGRALFRTMLLTLAISTVLMLLKFGAYFVTGSNAILSDAAESIINVAAGGAALFSVYFASLPRDINHPYGHGKIEFFSAGLEGALIVVAAFGIIIRSVFHLFNPQEIEHIGVGLGVTVFGGLVNMLMGLYLIKVGKKSHSVTVEADGHHLMSDVYSSLGLAVGLALIYITKWNHLDNILAILFSAFIFYSGYMLLRRSVAGLMDEADPKILQKIINAINLQVSPNWIDLHNLRVQNYGALLHINGHLVLPYFLTLEESEAEALEFERIINDALSEDVEVFIHLEACSLKACKLCKVETCLRRVEPYQESSQLFSLQRATITEAHYLDEKLLE